MSLLLILILHMLQISCLILSEWISNLIALLVLLIMSTMSTFLVCQYAFADLNKYISVLAQYLNLHISIPLDWSQMIYLMYQLHKFQYFLIHPKTNYLQGRRLAPLVLNSSARWKQSHQTCFWLHQHHPSKLSPLH